MCGRLTQYRGIHDFVAALSMPNALANSVGDQSIERYNVAPKGQKETRIIDTLEPLVANHRFVVNMRTVDRDADSVSQSEHCQPYHSFFHQFTRLTADRGYLKADDRLDSVAIGVARLTAVMDVNPDEGVKVAQEGFIENAMEGLMNVVTRTLSVCGISIQASEEEGPEGSWESLNWMDNL